MSALAEFPRITPFLWFDNNAEDAVNFYLSVFKNFPLGGEGKRYLQFRFEAFNFLNHPNWGNPGNTWGSGVKPSATFGVINSTSIAMRQLQFALKYVF